MKKYTFNGYIKAEVEGQLEGYLTLKDGMPRNAVLYPPAGNEIKGQSALKKIRDMDNMEELRIQVHTNVDIDSLISSIPGKIPVQAIEESQEDTLKVEGEKKTAERKKLEEELESRIIEQEMKESKVAEKEIEVYDTLIKERRGLKSEEPGKFPDKFSFENFVVGPNNKFAYAAAREIARFPGDSFNPLFITSSSGLGKTHLLKAIGNYLKKRDHDLEISYLTASNLSSILSNQDIKELKEEVNKANVLLLDDIQFLANKIDLQDEVFHILNNLLEKKGQVVLTSDRPPDQIPSLQDRMVTRFKSGLVVDIRPPTFETRVSIIDKILKEYDIKVEQDVKEYIARHVKKNVRELEGVLNRILAFSSLLEEDISKEVVKESLKHYSDEIDKGEKKVSSYTFKVGRSYLIEERRPDKGFEILKGMRDDGKTYIFSRLNPNRIKEDYGVKDSEIYWLTSRDSQNYITVSPNLENLSWRLEDLLKEDGVVLLDGLEYLISNTGFEPTIQFLRHMIDMVSETETVFLLTVSPDALERKHVSILEREMEVISEEDSL